MMRGGPNHDSARQPFAQVDRRGVCLFGGTFDPPHIGHLMMAEVARETLDVGQVLFIPAAAPPHKLTAEIAPLADRLDMVQASIASFPQFALSTVEAERPGPSYTIDTLRIFHALGGTQLFLLVGADMLEDLPNWRGADEINRLATVVAAPRSGKPIGALAAEHARRYERAPIVLDMPELDIASSWIRDRVGGGLRVDPLLPAGVRRIIEQRGLYRP